MGSAPYYSGRVQPHFLDSCSLCRRPLSQSKDIFMYRGDTPFCSQECRQEQIEVDEASEKRWNRSLKKSSKSGSRQQQGSESGKESDAEKAVPVRMGTVAVVA